MPRIRVFVLGILLCALAPLSASGADPFPRKGPHAPAFGPACDEPRVLNRVVARFDKTEAKYWHTGVRMAGIENARPASTRTWPPKATIIRYCTGTAYLSDGSRYELVYWVRAATGFAGYGWGIEFCLTGRDRQLSYAPHCRMLRPM